MVTKTISKLREIRKGLGLTQVEMADRMGMSRSGYIDAEINPNRRNILAAEYVAIEESVVRNDITIVPPTVAKLLDQYANIEENA